MDMLPKLPSDQSLHISNEGLQYILNNFNENNPEKNFLWTTDYRVELPVRVKKYGFGSEKPYTFTQLWRETLQRFPDHNALNFQVSPNKWITWTYKQYYHECTIFAKALISLGVKNYSAVNIIGFNSPEWVVAFSGSIFGNYLPIGMYTTNGPDACAYIANHSEAQVIILEDRNHLMKYVKIKDQVKNLKYFVLYKDEVPKDLDPDFVGKVLTWSQLMQIGKKQYKPNKKQDELQYRMTVAKPGNCCTFIYTSGTTGPPKAVMVSHDNYTWTTDASARRFGFFDESRIGKGRMLSLLPLSHVAAQFIDIFLAIRCGFSLFFSDPTALQGNLVKFLLVSRPTCFLCVPRVWQKIEEKITIIGSQTTGIKRKIADWAKSKGPEGTYAQQTGKSTPKMWGLAKKLVFNKIKQNLGLDQCEYMMYGAAPLRESTRQFFLNLNIFLLNVFGMSQLAGPQTFTDPLAWDNYTSTEFLREAGKPLEGLEVLISNPDIDGNGQICLRGRNNFMGYFKNEEETKNTVDKKGFVHSGDIGIVRKNGVLSITGRIKELIITAGGQNIAPVLIQNQINTFLPIFSSVVVIGDKRKYLTCLLCLKLKDKENLADELIDYIKERGSQAQTVQQAIKCSKLKAIIEDGIKKANEKAISKAHHIIKFTILPLQFSVEQGTFTPTLKLKRKVVNQMFEKQIQAMYIDAKL